jgi:hypothetical protein
VNYKSGSATIPSGSSSIGVTFPTAMANTNFAVSLVITSTTDFAEGAECTSNDNGCFWYVAVSKTTSGFTIGLREAENGAAVNANANVTFDWIVIPYNNP